MDHASELGGGDAQRWEGLWDVAGGTGDLLCIDSKKKDKAATQTISSAVRHIQ